MKLTKLIAYDIQQGIIRNLVKLLPVVIILVLEFVLYTQNAVTGISEGFLPESATPTTGNYLSVIFCGIPEYVPSNRDVFPVPFLWLLFFIYLHYSMSAYPKSDIYGFGQQVILKAGNRCYWWLSKLAFVFAWVTVYFCATVIICLVFGQFNGGATIEPNEILGSNDVYFEFTRLTSTQLILNLILMPFFISLSLAFAQLVLSFVFSPIISLLSISVVYIASAYFMSPFLPGEYAMLKRSNFSVQNGVSTDFGMVLSVVISVVSIVLGFVAFNKMDILSSKKVNED